MKKCFLALACALSLLPLSAQVTERVETEGFTGHHIAALQGRTGRYQGMDIYKNWIFSCEHTGIASIYAFNGRTIERRAQFDLATQDALNHANVASFGVEKVSRKDPFPVVYISQCHKKPFKDGRKDLLFVERIRPDLKGSELVQTIFFDDVNKRFGYALQWVVDREEKMLYGYGNTTRDKDLEGNRHRIVKFRLPSLSEGAEVVLREKDLLENYLIEDSGYSFATIGQGLCIHKGVLYMPVGTGKPKYPSYLLCWNLRTRQMDRVLDISRCTFSEPEDCAWWRGRIVLQAMGGIFTVKLR